jgi:anaerobic magnesium-protoporphyrin IX monomethyl ester cyclase
MKVLFVVHGLDYADHIAISYLSAMAKKLNHETYFCTLEKERFCQNDLLSMVAQVRPDVVAYSLTVVGFQSAVALNRHARQIHPFTAILGGAHATYSPETFPMSGMDSYCIGEGDTVFYDFLQKVEKGESYDEVPNLITTRQANPMRDLIANLDDLPFPDRDLVLANSGLKNVPKKTFYATRGCPYNCTYCANNYYRSLYLKKGTWLRRFSVERVIQEIEYVKARYRMDFVKFGDDIFVFRHDAWLEEFAEKYARRIGIPFNCYLRVDLMEENILKLLKKAGCYSLHLSVDSTSRHVREKILGRSMRKDNQVVIEALRNAHRLGINTWVNYMLAAPESTIQDDLDSIEMSRKGKATYPSYSITVPMKGTALHKISVEKGFISPDYEGDLSGTSQRSVLNCFSAKEKDIQLNIFLLGAIVAKMPAPLHRLGIAIIKRVPPNRLFRTVRQTFYRYAIENLIFKVAD